MRAGDIADLDGGFIVRTAANGAPNDAIVADIRRIGDIWHDILARRDGGDAPIALRDGDDPIVVALRDFVSPSLDSVLVDTHDGFNRARALISKRQYRNSQVASIITKAPMRCFRGTISMARYSKALTPVVPLSSGGSLVIEPNHGAHCRGRQFGQRIGFGGADQP